MLVANPQPPEMLTVEEAADFFRTTRGGLYAQRHRGEYPGALGVRVGRRILFRRIDIDAWYETRRQESGAA
jgi:excisionase family DNA binding protein